MQNDLDTAKVTMKRNATTTVEEYFWSSLLTATQPVYTNTANDIVILNSLINHSRMK